MIDSKELRIGNLIERNHNSHRPSFEETGKEWEPTIVNGKLIFLFEDNPILCSHYNYIELSEQWLLRFNFSITTESAFWKIFSLDSFVVKQAMFSDEHGIVKGEFYFGDDINTEYNIDTVHNLQNLFQSLHGKELTLQPQP